MRAVLRDVTMALVAVGLLMFAAAQAMAQQPPAPPSREALVIEALRQQRDQAADGVAACHADARVQIRALQDKVAELEKKLAAAAPEKPADKPKK